MLLRPRSKNLNLRTAAQSQQTQITQWTNQNSKQKHETSAKRGKMRASKSQLVLGSLLIGWESGAIVLTNHTTEWSETKAKVYYFRPGAHFSTLD